MALIRTLNEMHISKASGQARKWSGNKWAGVSRYPRLNVNSSAVILLRPTRAQKFNIVGLRLRSTLALIDGDVCMNAHGFVFTCSSVRALLKQSSLSLSLKSIQSNILAAVSESVLLVLVVYLRQKLKLKRDFPWKSPTF